MPGGYRRLNGGSGLRDLAGDERFHLAGSSACELCFVGGAASVLMVQAWSDLGGDGWSGKYRLGLDLLRRVLSVSWVQALWSGVA